jgi:hypothetical protein
MEEGQVEAPAADASETTETPEGFVNKDGSLVEGWQTRLTDPVLHEDKTLQSFKNLEGLAKSYVHVRKQVPLDKIAIPTEKSSQLEWDEFWKAGGRPETPQDYNLTVPDDLPEGLYTKERLAEAQEVFHKIGLSAKQAAALMEYDQNLAKGFLQAQEQQRLMQREESKNKLLQLWGNAYEQRTHFGNVAINEGCSGDIELQNSVCEKYGDDPDFIQLLSNLGAKFVERGSIQGANIPTPGDLDRQIEEEMQKPVYGPKFAEHGFSQKQHEAQVTFVQTLFRKRAENTRTG